MSPDDLSFREAMCDVQPRATSDRLAPAAAAPPSPRARSAEADERAVLAELQAGDFDLELLESGEWLAWRGPGLQDTAWRKLRRGGFRIAAELDLHGFNRQRAQGAVQTFLALCQDRDLRCVRIIHGKGNRSPNSGPILKSLLDSWLRRRRDVLAFCSARPHDGGSGAIYVLLRAASRTD